MQKKHILILITSLALFVVGMAQTIPTLAQSATETSAATFKMPDDAVTTYFEGLKQGDVEKIYSACAINEIAENYKFDLTIQRIRAFSPPITMAPSEYPLFAELNKEAVASRIAMQVKLFAFSLLSSEPIDMSNVTLMDIDAARKFIQDVDPSRLSGLELIKIDLPNKELMSSARYLSNATTSAATYGADESTERVALFSFEQNTYLLGFTLLRFGDNWKILSVNSPLANTSSLGTPVKMSPEEFDALNQ